MWPTTCTWFDPPRCTSIEPDPVSICKSTFPFTCSVRSNSPRAEAKVGKAHSANIATATPTKRREFRSLIISSCPRQNGHGTGVPCPSPGVCRDHWRLLQDHLVAFFQSAQDLSLGAIRNSDVDRNFCLAVLPLRIRDFNRRFAIFVVNDCAFRNLQHVLVLFQNDFRVGGHLSFQFAGRVEIGRAS